MHVARRAVGNFTVPPGIAGWLAPLLCALALIAGAGSSHAQVIGAGNDHICTVSTTGGTVCWGSNQYGQIGDGSTVTRTQPTNVSGLPFNPIALDGGWGHTCATTAAGALKCWGWNEFGQLGDGTVTQRNLPADVSGLGGGVAGLAIGRSHSCVRTSGGAVKCWGAKFTPDSNQGQLGNGGNSGSLSAIDVTGLGSGVSALAAGKNHTCAVVAGGGVKCWGANDFDQLGRADMSLDDATTPVDVAGLVSGVQDLTAGEIHTCALTSGGGVKCWGYGEKGALGDGTTDLTHPVPGDVTGLTSGVSALTAGAFHTCALTSAGAVKCWGDNQFGQLGDGTTTQRNTPVTVVGSGVIAIAAGAAFTCALTTPGVTQCWGANANGQVGNGVSGGPAYVPTGSVFPSATTTTLTSALNPSVFGDSVTFTATVSGSSSGTTVQFQNGGVTIADCGAQTVVAGSATCTTGGLQAGTRSITAIYQGNAATLASTSAILSQVVNKADQTIVFDALADKIDTDPPFTVSAAAGSGLAVAFTTQAPLVCTVSGNSVSLLLAGTCVIAADQAGSGNFNAAPQVVRSFTVVASGPALALLAVKSRKTHGAAGTFDLPVNPATAITGAIDVEPRVIGAGHQLVFEFNIPITAAGTVVSQDAAAAPIGSAMSSASGNNVIVTLTGIADAKRVKVTLSSVNGGMSVFSASIGYFVGDVSNNRLVSSTDIGLMKGRSGTVNASTFRYDINLNGSVTTTDIGLVKGRSGSLP